MPDTKISALTAASSFVGTDQIPVNEAGTTKRVTGAQIQAWLTANQAAPLQYSPSNPTGTTSSTGVMMGLGNSITPIGTGRLSITISGTIFNAGGVGDGAKVQIRQGSGSLPTNGAALTGTAVGGQVQFVSSTTAERVPFALQAVVTGFTPGVAIWIDVALYATVGGTANVTDISL